MTFPLWAYDVAEFISLWLTTPQMIGCAAVVFLWIRPATRKTAQWITIGVFFSHLGKFGDGGYWGVAWSADYMRWETKDWWFSHGVFSNIFFRQACGIISPYSHLRSLAEMSPDSTSLVKKLNQATIAAFLIGFLVAIAMLMLR